MPIFEYKCGKCGRVEEVLQKSAEVLRKVCPDCKGRMEKQFSSFSVGVKQPGGASKCISCTDRGCPHAGGLD
ncbi:MAG TPA: zinc ribbon domain-containing protein [Anaerohalosphaeraceae bacterium]|jgi:putative FmdB family regulatory protein|nr:zinc ribbon domain-containing protein [Anaerohalosphaeraceae bacterium]HRT51543.1 zinc ribbon domain-containing protein [Anaerohalosphaeraceae bacterium]HRT87560.1 zinc ribbon domain-containing protein [Anaerohalosphaeraceae bacterium]